MPFEKVQSALEVVEVLAENLDVFLFAIDAPLAVQELVMKKLLHNLLLKIEADDLSHGHVLVGAFALYEWKENILVSVKNDFH